MHKVSRIYVANAGYKLAWYDGLLLQFTDTQTNEPTHTIFNLVNQGGKTTFLSLFFSTFDTPKDRFLQHLSNRGQRFEHYFDKAGLPGFVVVEWSLPGDLASPTRTLVTGQIVVMKKAGDTFEPDRLFFWFHGTPGLTLESIPASKLGATPGTELRSRDQVMQWLHTTRQQHPGHFDYTQNQSDWRQALESEGLDVEMLRHQVDFNRKEGSMDESFLDFKTEYDFTRRFLALALDSRSADDVRELVATHCRRMTRRKPLEASRLQLTRLQDTFAGFAQAARDYLERGTQRQDAENRMATACATLAGAASERLGAADKELAYAETQDQLAATFTQEKTAQLQIGEALQQEQLNRTEAQVERELQAAQAAVGEAEREIHLCQAAELLAEQERQQAAIDQLNRAIEAANTDIQPFREDRQRKLAWLRGALLAMEQDRTRQAESEHGAAKVALKQLELTGEDEQQLHQSRTKAERHSAQLEQRLADAGQRHANLVRERVLGADESPDVALNRLAEEVKQAGQQLQNTQARAEGLDGESDALHARHLRLNGEHAKQLAQVDQLDKETLEGDSWRDRLAHDASLTRAIGADVADPDSELLSSSVTRFIQRTQDLLSEEGLVLSRLEEDEKSIQDSGLAGHDPDVSRVVRHLANAGVANVTSYPAYLAEVLPQEGAARGVVLSDPGRFLGVAVPNPTQLDLAQAALRSPPALQRPVIVSLATDQPVVAELPRLVVPAADDSHYNYAAAQARGLKLADRLSHVRQRRDELLRQLQQAHVAETRLAQYQAKYGHGHLALLRQELQQARDEKKNLAAQLTIVNQGREAAQAAAKAEHQEAMACLTRQSQRAGQQRQVQAYVAEYFVHLTDWQAQLAEACQAIGKARKDLDALTERKQQLDTERMQRVDAERRLRLEAQTLGQELAHLPPGEAPEGIEPNAQPVEDLRSAYQTADGILGKMEAEKTGHLVVQRDEIQKGLNTTKDKYQVAAQGLQTDDIRAHLGLNYRDAIQQATAGRRAAETLQLDASQTLGKARQDLTVFTRERQYRSFNMPGLSEWQDADLAFERHAAEQAARSAEENEGASKEQAQRARETAAALKQEATVYAGQRDTLQSLLPVGIELPPPDPAQLPTPQDVGELCARLTRALKDSEVGMARAHKAALAAHEKVQRIAGEESFADVDLALSTSLKGNPLEAAIHDYARIERAIADRISAVVSELDTMEQDFERATEALGGLVTTSLQLLRRATEVLRLPDNVPVVGGLTVVKMSRAVLTLTQEGRRVRLKPYMEELAGDGNIPENGAALATQALLRLADNHLGLRILKMVDVADEQYVPVDGLSHSGAERISMALLLYFIIAKLRYEQRPGVKKAGGGVLLLDNPFAKATARPIWQVILGLADAMGVQLIIATGIKEYDTLSVFNRFLRLAKTERNVTTGRTHVSVADFNFVPESDAAAAHAHARA